MSLGVASAHEVGFESGQISGAAADAAIARIAGSVNAPAWPLVPIKIVGFTC